jgi:thiol-disulfide isomerase/thioredoxin
MAILFFACSEEKQNIINGKIEGLAVGDKIILSVEDPDGAQWLAVDSVIVEKAGEFTLKTKLSDYNTQLVYLKSGEQFNATGNYPFCFLEGYATINIRGHVDNWHYIKMDGGIYNHPALQEYMTITDSAKTIQQSGIKLIDEANKNNDSIARTQGMELIQQSNEMFMGMQDIESSFMRNNPDVAYSAVFLRYEYDLMEDFDKYEEAFYSFTPRVQATPVGVAIKTFIDNTRASEVGAVAPSFTLRTLDGHDLSLSDFEGKYVMLDFWGSWCGPCRMSSPKLVELYNKLKQADANIEFVGIACRETKDENWIKAIENDNLVWTQLNDAHSPQGQSIQKRYAVDGVPTCILISPEGKIVYRDHPFDIIPKIRNIFSLHQQNNL